MEELSPPTHQKEMSGARSVASGILWSRAFGLVRESLLRSVLGLGPAADAFGAALRIPNLLQNLLGEGSLSASFIPVYSRLLSENREKEARRVAGAIAGLMAILSGGLALLGILLARPITALLAPGFDGPRYELTIDLIRVTTAGTGFLVLSAWCLGVLNSHGRFFLPYAAPVLWNAAQILVLTAALIGNWEADRAARILAWGLMVGGLLQFVIQAIAIRNLFPKPRLNFDLNLPGVIEVRRRFIPALLGRGVVQISGYLDLILASLLATGAVAALLSAQALYLVPLSLFAISVAASELPKMSRSITQREWVHRTNTAVRSTAFFTLFSSVAYITIGEFVVEALFGWGAFDSDDTRLVWLVLAAYSLGLPATSMSRVLQGACYSIGDTRGPAHLSIIRMIIATSIGLILMFRFDKIHILNGSLNSGSIGENLAPHLGAIGLALGSAVAAWVEFVLLSKRAQKSAPELESPITGVTSMAVAGALTFTVGAILNLLLRELPAIASAPIALGISGLFYVAVTFRSGIPEAHLVLRPIRRRLWR